MTADLQELFDRAGRNPPVHQVNVDEVLHLAKARRSRNRRITSAVAIAAVVMVTAGIGLGSQRLTVAPDPVSPGPSASPSVAPVPEPTSSLPPGPLPTSPSLGSTGRLAYASDGDIYTADADGSNPVKIADGVPDGDDSCGGFWAEGPMWSPDGRYLAFRGEEDADPTPTRVLCSRTVNISDQDGTILTSFPADGWGITWSPDSTRVAAWVDFYPGTTVQIYGVDGARKALLTLPKGVEGSGDYDPVWTPDGNALLLAPAGLLLPVDGSPPQKLGPRDPPAHWSSTYSPGGGAVAYLSIGNDGIAALVAVAADGTGERVLVPRGVQDFAWSPTGDRIAFAAVKEGERQTPESVATELGVVDVATGVVTSLTDMGGAQLSIGGFSPGGDSIMFTKWEDGGTTYSLWSADADGSNSRRLAEGPSLSGDWQLIPTR